MQILKWLERRECGLKPEIGDYDRLMKRIYETTRPYHCLYKDASKAESEYGGVFNLEFTPEGKVLVAACEKKSILMFDVNSSNCIHKITDAHTDNVNCIRFINDRIFATCSDDTTVALWDLRYMKSKVRTLHGHSNWVKNIEYSQKEKLLVTSGFDGSIFTWDINSHTENGLLYQKVFHTSGLMRCRISPETESGEKLVICTTGGYMMVIHNLDLSTLLKDLSGFRPIIYRLMQMGEQYIPQAAKYAHVFSKKQKKNRVEFITDFPEDNDAEVILSLQIHPKGHSFLSRNINHDEKSEWSCIHNINEEPSESSERLRRKRKLNSEADDGSDDDEDDSNEDESRNARNTTSEASDLVFSINRRNLPRARLRREGNTLRPGIQPQPGNQQQRSPISPRAESFVPDIWAAEVTVQERAIRQNRARNSNSVTGYNFVYAISSGVLPARFPAPSRPTFTEFLANPRGISANNNNNNNNNDNDDSSSSSSSSTVSLTSFRRLNSSNRRTLESESSAERSAETSSPADNATGQSSSLSASALVRRARANMRANLFDCPESNSFSLEPAFFQNAKKLMYYIQESNKGKGYIKEPCFSADGRIVCSPFDRGVRLLAFNESCSEPRYPAESSPKPLNVVANIQSHSSIVLCAKFCPTSQLLATGCRSGNIIWHYPRI